MKREQTKKGVYKNLLTGGIASAISRSIMNPLERIEILRQTQNCDYKNLSFYSSIAKVYKTQGISGFFKGNGASLVRIFPFSAIEFYSIELAKNVMRRFNASTKDLKVLLICGTFSGWAATTATFPLDLVRTRLSVNTENSKIKETSIIESLRNVYMAEGIKGLYKGYALSSIGGIAYTGIKQTIFEFLKNNFPLKKHKNAQNLIYGLFAGVFGTLFLYPNYVLKRIAQASNEKNFSLKVYIKKIYEERGIKGFYSGLTLNLVKTGPYFGLMFLCNEKLKEIVKF